MMTRQSIRTPVPGYRSQRGAAAVFAALAMSAGLVALLLAIDLGRLYWAQREVDREADMAALDAARKVGGCMGVVGQPAAVAYSEAQKSIERNRRKRDDTVRIDTVLIGRQVVAPDGTRLFAPAPDAINRAVQVQLSRPLPQPTIPIWRSANRRLTAVAAAQSSPYASVQIGSTLVDLNPQLLNNYLSGLLGGDVSVSAVGYQSLADAQIPVGELLNNLTDNAAGDAVNQVFPLRAFLQAIGDSLQGTGNALAQQTVDAMAQAADVGRNVVPAEVIAAGDEAGSVINDSLVSAGGVAIAAARDASEPLVQLALPVTAPFSAGELTVRLIDPGVPRILSPNQLDNFVANAQGIVQAVLAMDLDSLNTKIRLPIWVQTADARGEVSEIYCARAGQAYDEVLVNTHTAAVRAGIGQYTDLAGANPQPAPAELIDADLAAGTLGISVPVHLRVTATALAEVPSADQPLTFTSPFDQPQQVAGGARVEDTLSRLPNTLQLSVELTPAGTERPALLAADAALKAALDAAVPVITRLVENRLSEGLAEAGDLLSSGTFNTLGLSVNGAEVRVYDVVAGEPYLFQR